MLSLLKTLWNDEAGMLLSAEAALAGTTGVLAGLAGLNYASESINGELRDFAYAFRGLDQSYCVEGQCGCGAWTAGSSFLQEPVSVTHERMRAEEARIREQQAERLKLIEGRRETPPHEDLQKSASDHRDHGDHRDHSDQAKASDKQASDQQLDKSDKKKTDEKAAADRKAAEAKKADKKKAESRREEQRREDMKQKDRRSRDDDD